MHWIALALSLVISVTGCAYRPIAVETDFETSTPGPLAVRLLPPDNGMLRFLTSEPAYVAVFEIIPGLGVSMLYPLSRNARVSSAGVNTTLMPSRVQGRRYYADAQYYNAVSTFRKPRYLYAIASRSPLPLDEIQLSPLALRSTLGWRSFLAHDLSGTLDDIERLVAGSLPEDDWSSDLYVVWPDVPLDLPWQMQYTFIPCADGRMVLVPLGWNIAACPGTANLAKATKPSPPPGTRPPPVGPDSTEGTGIPGRPGGRPQQPNPERPLARIPGDSPITRPGSPDQGERRPPVREPEGRPTPAPAPPQNPPRSEPPRSEPPRSEPPRPAPAPAPTPREPAEPKPAEKP